ncbi:MAG: Stk1 family PASTA domain-containing Ser/Thr kinase [Oscillospiraceae bacterium]|jgi:serine/threonine-protein kinase|nr:Stk1 family PASTA domain-containing Ser/Thr kinase [Oscillospiraceae bacterium]
MDSNIGQKLDGRYELLEMIGAGGMADIYRARDIQEDKIVAVKILRTEFAGKEDSLRRFRNESKAVAMLSHPNIVKIFDVGFTDRVSFIVMEYVDGVTLAELIERDGALKWRDAAKLTAQILRALQHAHDNGIVHRDVKPSNVMLADDGEVKVMDFGIARFNREVDMTRHEKAIGTVHYISPEQAQNDETDEKSDIYSVGVVLFEMLTGKKPFTGDSPVAVATKHINDEPPKPSTLNPAIPDGLEEIVLRAMRKDPRARYMTAGDMVNDLEEIRRNPGAMFGYNQPKTSLSRPKTNSEDAKPMNDKYRKPDDFEATRPIPNKSRQGYIPIKDKLDDEDDDHEFDEDEYLTERRSPLLPILLAVASVFVIFSAILIYKIVTDKVGGITAGAGEDIVVPKLVGMLYEDAVKAYGDLNLIPTQEFSKEFDKDVIMEQGVSEGRKIKSNQRVEVVVSKGAHLIDIADYSGGLTTLEDAESLIKKQGFPAPNRVYEYSTEVAEGFVIRTEPAARTLADEDTVITVYVSMGELGKTTTVPDLINLSESALDDRASMYKIVITRVNVPSEEDKKGRVISQNINPLTEVPEQTVVEVQIGTGVPPVIKGTLPPTGRAVTVNTSVTGKYVIEYYIDGNLQANLTENRNIELNRDIFWEFTGNGIHTYTIMITSEATGRSATFLEYKVDFSGTEPVYEELVRNATIFREINDGAAVTDEPYTDDSANEGVEDEGWLDDPTENGE